MIPKEPNPKEDTSKKSTGKNLSEVMYKKYDILQLLHSETELSLAQIARKLGIDDGNVSRYIAELEKEGLIKTRLAKDIRKDRSGNTMAGGKPGKLCTLTIRVRQIMALFEARPMGDPSRGQIEELLSLLENKNLSEDFQEFVASKLSDIAIEHPDTLLGNDQIKLHFEKIMAGKSGFEEKISKKLRSAVSISLMQILQDTKTKAWFDEKIRNILLEKISDETATEEFRDWAINTITRAARVSKDQKLLTETIDSLLTVYFKKDNNSETVKNELLEFEPEFQKLILEKIRAYTADPSMCSRAEKLLTPLISIWMSSNFSRRQFQN